jgi:hypothetical protein
MKNIPATQIRFLLYIAAGILFFGAGTLFAQDAAEIDEILESSEVSFSKAAAFVLAAAEVSPDSAADLQPALPPSGKEDAPIRLGQLCFLVMEAFHIKGSFLYAIFPGPRYGYREMQYLGLVPEPSDPAMPVSGLQLMQIVERVLHYTAGSVKE